MMPSILSCNNCGAANQPQAAYCRSCGSSLQAVKPTLYNSATGRLLANVTLKQRYHIIAPVGKGGMGAVYKAEDTLLGNRPVALKEMSQSGLSPQEQKEAADAFRQEALMLARLQHPNLPNIFDHFDENGRWYLAMSFIEGETLEEYLGHAQGGKLPLEEVLQIGTQLCSVLGYLHNRQPAIIFRDLKPANIMRTSDGHIYLIDFGIARHFKPGQAKDTAYYGSMGYAPPEQYGKAQTTARSDIYSLGATLYQLVSGHDPSSSPFRFPLLQSLVPSAPAGLATLLTQMLELDEDKRPASVLLVKQELQVLTSSPVQKPGLQTPTPNPTSVAPTQPAKPHPSPSAAPTQPASSNIAFAPSTTQKLSGWALVVSGVVAIVQGYLNVFLYFFVKDFTNPWWRLDELFVVTLFVLSSLGLAGLQIKQADRARQIWLTGIIMLFLGNLGLTVYYILLFSPAIYPSIGQYSALFNVSQLLSLVGTMLVGIAIVRAEIFPRWPAIVLILSQITRVLYFTPLGVPGQTSEVILSAGVNTLVFVALVGCGHALLSRHKVVNKVKI